jgi:transcriptional regulator with XRE-family HTH domain
MSPTTRRSSPVALRFGILVAQKRRAAGLPQDELARLTGKHRTEISLLERGLGVPRLDTVILLAAGLEIEPDNLIEGIRWRPGTKSFDGTPTLSSTTRRGS